MCNYGSSQYNHGYKTGTSVYFQSDYLALADQLSEYVVRLLDKVRGHDELEKLLNKRKREPDDETYEQLSRLKLAIHYSEKKVSEDGRTLLYTS